MARFACRRVGKTRFSQRVFPARGVLQSASGVWREFGSAATSGLHSAVMAGRAARSSLRIDEIGPAILGPGGFVVPERLGTFLAPADCLQLRVLYAVDLECLEHRFGAPLTQREVVFRTAAFIGVPLDLDG